IGEVGSNRTLIDVAARTRAFATLAGRSIPSDDDLKQGLLHAMRGRIRARSGDSFQQNAKRVGEFLARETETALRNSGKVYWCRFFRSVLKENRGEAESLVAEGRRLAPDPALKAQLATEGTLFPKFRLFLTHVTEREHPPPSVLALDAGIAEFGLLEHYSLFSCEDGGAEDDVAG
ncbi:MAG TPA: hypothetical protein VJS68_04590, partial [Thermoplasmata archaeon]|nr:hypothetical protein [Thermoplasmata archaeon]